MTFGALKDWKPSPGEVVGSTQVKLLGRLASYGSLPTSTNPEIEIEARFALAIQSAVEDNNIVILADCSTLLHAFLRATPTELWTCESLENLLGSAPEPLENDDEDEVASTDVTITSKPIPIFTASQLVRRWKEKGGWSSDISDRILEELATQSISSSRGQTHCEAGILASLVSEISATTGDIVIPNLQQLREHASEGKSIPIGVAKKCCPACYRLAQVIIRERHLQVQLPGYHARWHPWVPPHWLPNDIMAELELDFLRVVEAQAVAAWPTSSASSPTSDVGLMENFADDIDSSTDAWLEQVKLRFR
ncbi:hypothetical protein C8J57DRAFT_1497569 [Mycena rebaudengoi]|nr:hypothetical protein C8J57DRAFT_1497569 [Mycena rebaudengoi]